MNLNALWFGLGEAAVLAAASITAWWFEHRPDPPERQETEYSSLNDD